MGEATEDSCTTEVCVFCCHCQLSHQSGVDAWTLTAVVRPRGAGGAGKRVGGVCTTAQVWLQSRVCCADNVICSLTTRRVAERCRTASQYTHTQTHVSAVLRTVLPPTLGIDQRAAGCGCCQKPRLTRRLCDMDIQTMPVCVGRDSKILCVFQTCFTHQTGKRQSAADVDETDVHILRQLHASHSPWWNRKSPGKYRSNGWLWLW